MLAPKREARKRRANVRRRNSSSAKLARRCENVAMALDDSTLERIAELICGDDTEVMPVYRSGTEITRFFARAGIPRMVHDGTTRKWWTVEALKRCTSNERKSVLTRLASPKEYGGNREQVRKAINVLNEILAVEGICVTLQGSEPVFEKLKQAVVYDTEPEEEKLKPLPPPDFLTLGLEAGVGELLAVRWNEVQKCVDAEAYLSALIMMGSMLEGLLLGVAQRFPRIANQAKSAPTDKTGKVKLFWDWTLGEMIDVAHEVHWIDLDVRKFSHALRDFRNLVHPYQQLATGADPDEDTCGISWLVVQAAVNDLAKVLKQSP